MNELSTGVLTILGIGMFGGILGATVFQRLRIPQVVGYIAMGLLIGDVGIGIVTTDTVRDLESLNLFALGVIGFLVGGELRLDTFRTQGRQLVSILLLEGIGAFVLVSLAIGALLYAVSNDPAVAIAGGIVFGAIASATDPASTLNVLWEYRCLGPLSTALVTIVALDDALAMTLYGLGTTAAQLVTGGETSILGNLAQTLLELGGAVVLGLVSAYVLMQMARWLRRRERNFGIAIGVILLVIGVAASLTLDVILATMTLGVVLVNIAPRRSEELFETIRSFAEPIYVIFFVLVGARLDLTAMPPWLWAAVAIYVVGRSAGKIAGAYLGGRLTAAPRAVRRYAGMGLFAQGGIAVGLSIMAAHRLGDVPVTDTLLLSDAVVFSVTASTIVLQLIGPPLIKRAAQLAHETGRDVKEEDVIASWRVRDAMNTSVAPITEGTPLAHVFQIFSAEDQLLFPVVNGSGDLAGQISLDELRRVMTHQDTWDWVLAADVMAPATDRVPADAPLADVLHDMRERGIEQLPVIQSHTHPKVLGVLDQRSVRIRVNEEVVKRRRPDEPPHTSPPPPPHTVPT